MDLLQLSQRLVPEMTGRLRARYRVLQRIALHQPIGRRSLAQVLGTTERVLRAEVDLLKGQGLIDVGPLGMTVTQAGEALLRDLYDAIARLDGRGDLEQRLAERLAIKRVSVVRGDSASDPVAVRDIGHAAGQVLREFLRPPCAVAVTGGSTMATLAEVMPRSSRALAVEVLPARGGLGERVEWLANTIASQLAEKLGGTYRMFHAPESLSESTAQKLAAEPAVAAIMERIRNADIVVHGIGEAQAMAKRRGLDAATERLLAERGAVAEAFGYYFRADGRTVYVTHTMGLRLEDLSRIGVVIAVAGGADKAQAICAAAKAYRIDALATDEGAARAILQL